MAELRGSKTEKNLWDAFAGESQARNKYTYFASVAKKEGYEQMAAIFLETAEQEKEHAKLHAKALGLIGDTTANLESAAAGELHEHSRMYPDMARDARAEGFEEIARMFENIATVEKEHEARYRKLQSNLAGGTVFAKGAKVRWRCRNCGAVIASNKAPAQCPVCKHPQAYFEVAAENY
ncbi:MAG TPA: rubrerythrin family protein [Phycisphaerales bacterium]|nr:rubrerythrin family protein [Phycisphaerales bacterium]